MTKLINIIIGITLLGALESQAQQLPSLGWFEKCQLYYNPAFAGSGEAIRGAAINRTQWKEIDGAPESFVLSADLPLGKNIGGGILVSHDKIGFNEDNNISFNGSYRLYLDASSNIQFGLRAGASLVKISAGDAFQWDDGDPLAVTANSFIPRIGFGVLYSRSDFHVGFSAPDFFSVDTEGIYLDESTAMRKNYILTSGVKIEISEYLTFVPGVLLKYYDSSGLNYILNAGFELNQTVNVGISYGNPKIYGLYGLVSLSPKVKFGYRHEYSPNSISIGEFGTGEFLLTYGFN